ncbi:farnesol dehydrogenase isoform X4 [Megachile rotundata]|uniref:farnesol dehydrogenase isoform X4 n=1 Tax=Megachile rotundata TaxID=143995 RepID=UPI003FD3BC94
MDRWNGKVAIVTGVSSGIGEKIAVGLVKHSVKVVGLARREDRLQKLSVKLGKDHFYGIQCDMCKEEDILQAFKWVEKELGGANILVNNAAFLSLNLLMDTPTAEYYKTIETNVIAPTICAREFLQSIKKRNTCGHIVNINSIAGHFAEAIHVPVGMYAASKYAVTALCSELRHEIIAANLNVKVTSISPGLVRTEMVQDFIANLDVRTLEPEDIADSAIYAIGTPERVEIHEITIIPHGTPIVDLNSSLQTKQ